MPRIGDAQKPEYLKLNPNAVVPTLVYDGRVITESTVICEYVDDQLAPSAAQAK
jgi:glutathione S-transferase